MTDPSPLPDAAPHVPEPRLEPPSTRNDDYAYALPMAAFLVLTWVGGKWESLFTLSYVLKTFAAGLLIIFFWKRYTKIRWDYWWLGVIVGVIGIFQWVGMEKALMHFWPSYPRIPASGDPFNPYTAFSSPAAMWAFIIIRWAGATIVVAFMEELFWRDWLWRTMIAPNDFKLAKVGEWDWKAFAAVALFFASVHPMWMTAIVWGAMVGGLLVWTRSLGACIIAHGVTNFLLGAYVQYTQEWFWW
jgi:CAAX prenyl protease-like protein